MSHNPRREYHRQPDETQDHSEWPIIVRSQNDVVHVPLKSGQGNERDVHDEEPDPGEHHQEMDGTRSLSSAKYARKPREMVHHGRRHRGARDDRNGSKDEDNGEICDLLKSVIRIKAIGLDVCRAFPY